MAGRVPEFGDAVAHAIEALGWTPEAVATHAHLNVVIVDAMCRGIVPMRSLVIRFAEAVARAAAGRSDVPDWWRDVDAWLRRAGLPPRRERQRDQLPAAHHYRPRYERIVSGNECVHVFWLYDDRQRPVFRFTLPGHVDYRRRAQRLKQELANLTKAEFDRRYARFRLPEPPG